MSDRLRPEPRIEQMLSAMEKWGVSDLFLTEGKVPAARRHGAVTLLDQPPTSPAEVDRFLESVAPPAARQRFAETGDLDVGFTLAEGRRFRLNLARQQGKRTIVARALPSGDLTLEGLDLPERFGALAHLARGLVLVTGATGAGKSTTLAALVNHINMHRQVHVVTIEEPIEFVHRDKQARITQREVGVDTVSFQVALRQAVRESPDVILIGEMRDFDTMRVAIQAALTGHLVLASLHTIDSAQTLQRVISYFPAEQRDQVALDLSMCLEAIISQRLLPRCDVPGRAVALELLTLTPPARRLVRDQRLTDLMDLMKASRGEGMVTFDRSLVALLRAGRIDYATGQAYASNAEEFALSAKGMRTGVATFAADEGGPQTTDLDMRALLNHMQRHGASDLHLSVGQPPTFRMTGELAPLDMAPLTQADVRLLIYSILSVRQRTTYELERELDFALAIDGGRRFRVNAFFERGDMAAAFRSIEANIPTAEELGLPDSMLTMGDAPHGLLLCVGPTGSGKTTSLACLINRINERRACHIITVEDPIEYSHGNKLATVHQREVGADTQSFSAALKYVLRQDPDVILIGELRDLDTVSAALTAAETGHLVLATLHTNDAVQTIDRVIDVFPAHQQGQARSQLSASLLGVVSQRLLRRADGQGRVAAFEVMVGTPAIRALIRENKMHQAVSVMQSGRGKGMVTLENSVQKLLHDEVIDRAEASRYVAGLLVADEPAS